jgi:FMN-dependent oxidoreductase (nitrilotriacetate monooxygenase family)
MKKEIRLNHFDMNCIGHIAQGLWAHPRDRSRDYINLDYWIDIAKTAERGLFDGIFLADVLGTYDTYAGNADASIRHAIQIPINDPMMLVPAMAAATTHLGFGITANVSFEAPYLLARRFSTLDHLTKGRVGFNVVTGYLASAFRGMGRTGLAEHDGRYDFADEYMDVVYRLWEESWADGSRVMDPQTRIASDPARVRRIIHDGSNIKLDAIHLSEPSPQRTPVIYQAGASQRGRDFAARHAECVFLTSSTKEATKEIVDDLRRRAAGFGRKPEDLKIFVMATAVTGASSAEAKEKFADYKSYVSADASIAFFSGATGIDFSRLDLDEPIGHVTSQGMRSVVDAMKRADADNQWTVRELMRQVGIGGRTPPFVGSGSEVADAMVEWCAFSGADGFNLSRTVMPECLHDFVLRVVPELQDRGVYKTAYRPGTLRRKLFGVGDQLLPSHPGAIHRQNQA